MATKCDADGVLTRTVYDDFGNVETSAQEINAPECPTPSYILPSANVITTTTVNLHGNMTAPGASTFTYKPSVFSFDVSTGTISDYDDPASDPTPDLPNDWWPVSKVQREIRFGQTRDIAGTIQAVGYSTRYSYSDAGYEIDGPRFGNEDRIVVTYHPGTSNIQFRDVMTGPGSCPGYGCLRTTYEDYDGQGNARLVIAPNGGVTRYQYNNWNKVAQTIQYAATADGQDVVTAYEFDGAGDLDKVILPEGNVIDHDYMGPTLLTSIKRRNFDGGPVIDEMVYEYDPEGNRTSERRYRGAAANGVITFETLTKFDEYSHIAEVVNGVGQTRTTRYSPTGLLLSSKDESGNETTYWYDALKRLYEVRPPDGGVTRYGYDINNNLAEVASCKVTSCDLSSGSLDPNKVVTRYLYDDFGRLVRSDSPDAGITEMQYDEAGNLIAKLDARGVYTFYTYDAANRLLNINYVGSNLYQNFFYDFFDASLNAVGRLAAAEDEAGKTVYEYDLLGRVVAETRVNNNAATLKTESRFDRNGNLRGLTYSSGIVVTYDPDLNDTDRVVRVRAQTPNGENIVADNIAYDPGKLLKALNLGNGLTTTIARDHALRTTELLTNGSNTTVLHRQFTYAANGNIEAIVDPSFETAQQSFAYDPANRLKAASGAYGVLSYSYDTLGNRLTDSDNFKLNSYSYAPQSNRLDTVIAPPLFAKTSTRPPTPGEKNAALVQINNQLLDWFFSGRRLLRQSFGVGSFSEGKSAANRKSNIAAATPTDLFLRKATDTTDLLKRSLADGTVTLDEVKASTLADARLQEQIDIFFEDMVSIPTDQVSNFPALFFGMFSMEDLMLVNEVLDLMGRVELPDVPPEVPPLPTEPPDGWPPELPWPPVLPESNTFTVADSIVNLTNIAPTPRRDPDWHALIENVRALSRLGKPIDSLASLTAPNPDAAVAATHIDAIKLRYGKIKARGVRPSQLIGKALEQRNMDRLLTKLGISMAPSLGATTSDEPDGLFATLEATLDATLLTFAFEYDAAGNASVINHLGTYTNYAYGEDNRLRGVGGSSFSYDHLGRRIFATRPGVYVSESSTVNQYWAYAQAGEMLSWVNRNTTPQDRGEETEENYIYLNGERIAKIVIRTALNQDGGGGGGGGCCCASTAIAYDGQAQCDLASFHALTILRGFRSQVLSGTQWGEAVIRFYYRDLSQAVVPILNEYPELRHAANYVLRGAAWVLEFWITPAHAAPDSSSTYEMYFYHNGNLGQPIKLTNMGGEVVRHVEHDPFGANEMELVTTVDDPMQFPGQFFDSDAQLYYNWNRWYSPEIGRYVEVEVIAPAEFGAYSYALNNPLLLSDTNGLLVSSGSNCVKSVIGGFSHYKGQQGADKFKHCSLSCEIAKNCGKDIARKIGLFKEIIHDKALGRGTFSIMDLVANEIGFGCSDSVKCGEKSPKNCERFSCQSCCTEKGAGPKSKW